MKIKDKQHFYGILFSKGVNKREIESKEKLLCQALNLEDNDMTRYIIENFPDELGIEALTIVAKFNFVLFMQMLEDTYKHKPDLDIGDLAMSCISEVTRAESISRILLLLIEQYNLDPNGKDGMIFTTACKCGNIAAVKYLTEYYRVDPNINDEMGFILACRFRHYTLARYLVEIGANINAKNSLCLKLLQKDRDFGNIDKDWLLELYK